jgi:AcrR family transcriptional regulator
MDAPTPTMNQVFAAPPPIDLSELDTHDRIVRAALEVFVEKGYGGTRVQDIAERAGLTAGALYVHFPNRSKLLAEAIVLEGDRILASIIGQLSDMKPGDIRVSEVMADQAVGASSIIDRLLLEAFALAARDPDALEQLRSTLDRFDDMILAQVQAGRERGFVSPDLDDDTLVTFLSSWMLGLIVRRGVDRPRPDRNAMSAFSLRILQALLPRD